MSLFTITTDTSNKDIPAGMTVLEARRHYHAMSNGFVSKLSKPVVHRYEDKYIFRGDASQSSLKGYGAEQLIAKKMF